MSSQKDSNMLMPIMLIMAALLLGWFSYSSWDKNKQEKEQLEQQQKIWRAEYDKNQSLNQNHVFLENDVIKIEINLLGGDVIYSELKKFKENLLPSSRGVSILDYSPERDHIAQSGILSSIGPDSREHGRGLYTVLEKDDNTLRLGWTSQDMPGLSLEKVYHLTPGSYVVQLQYKIQNNAQSDYSGYFYAQIRKAILQEDNSGMIGLQMYQGGVLYTADQPYKKITFEEMAEHPFQQYILGGWAGISQRYFLSAWVFDPNVQYQYFAKQERMNVYQIGAMGQKMIVKPQQKSTVGARLYVGPETSDLKSLAKGMDLTVDYGFLWPISKALLWIMKGINDFVHNWGWSIVFVTILIKLIFYKLSASSYRSMARLREVQPKILDIKKRYEHDKQRFSQAMVEFYRKEKINPLGGCLPILIQIPFFIALYYVLLESVEFRHAPFILWIQDLSAQDPYYVLPILMGASMLLQQKMGPQPPDPMQAKMMMVMPIIFTVLFMSAPAGLILYWVVNNLLSITQQAYITYSLNREGLSVYRG